MVWDLEATPKFMRALALVQWRGDVFERLPSCQTDGFRLPNSMDFSAFH